MFTNKISIEQTNLSNDFTNTDKSKLNTAYTNNHTHSNKSILDGTTASFTTAQETKLSNTSGVNTGNGVALLGTCSTASETAEKAVTLSGFILATGATIQVTFANANTSSMITLNVNSTGVKNIYDLKGNQITGDKFSNAANETCIFTYNGTNWVLITAPFWESRMAIS